MKYEVKHNEDIGIGHLWLNRWDIYGKVRWCFFWKYVCSKKNLVIS